MRDNGTQVQRTSEIEEFSNRVLIHPISRVITTRLARLGVHPNVVSVMGMVFGAGAALAYFHYESLALATLGFGLMLGWHVLDGVDGQLARMTGKTSELGKILDGLCDHVAFALVYLALTLALVPVFGAWVWAVALLAGVSHVVQAGAYEFQRQSYDYWVHGKAAARLVSPDELREQVRQRGGLGRVFGALHVAYVSMQHQLAGVDPELEARLAEAVRDPVRGEAAREAYRAANLPAVHRWTILCSNYRTLAIFAAVLLGNPLYFFLFELVVLNAAFLGLRAMQARINDALLASVVEPHPVSAPA
jgi:phosphatidylglycerophosphate synthase